MTRKLTLTYDRLGDILYIDTGPPYAEQESEQLEFGVVARLNPETEEVENLEILSFSARLLQGEPLELSITAGLRSADRS